jgi:hypothetical protein
MGADASRTVALKVARDREEKQTKLDQTESKG